MNGPAAFRYNKRGVTLIATHSVVFRHAEKAAVRSLNTNFLIAGGWLESNRHGTINAAISSDFEVTFRTWSHGAVTN